MEEMNKEPKLNLVLLGKTGAGKSASGNTILGRNAFESKRSPTSVTRDVAVESGTVNGIPVTVYDTPGLFDTNRSKDKSKQILENVLQKCESGLCVFLLVIKADRFTKEERKTVEMIEKLLGQKHLEKTWILFTRGDELEDENMTIKDFISSTKTLKNLVQKYNHRYHLINNKSKINQAQPVIVKILQRLSPERGKLTRQIPVIRPNAPDEQVTPVSSLLSRRIVLLGKTGVGKSAAGNLILGQKAFKSELKVDSVTRKCSDSHATVSSRSVTVVDTPGFFDTKMKPEELIMEIARSVYLSSPGPHAFLIVLRVDDRFTEHEQQIPQLVEMMFGEEVLKYSIILFTRGDQLEAKPIETIIKENSALRHLVQQCGGRYHVFNNKDEDNREQVNDLLLKIDAMIEKNGGGHYSNQMFEDALRFRQEEEERRLREEEERRQKLKEQRQREENERKQQEEKQRQEIEKVKKETEKNTRAEMEKQRQEEIEKEKKKTEDRIRAEMEEQTQEIEKVKKEIERIRAEMEEKKNKGFWNFLSKYKKHFIWAAVAVGVAVVGGAVAGGCIAKYYLSAAAAKTAGVVGGTVAVKTVAGGAVAVKTVVGGAVFVGAVAGGVAGGAAGGAAYKEVYGGNGVLGAVLGAGAGAGAGAVAGAVATAGVYGGYYVGAKLTGKAVSYGVGAVGKAVLKRGFTKAAVTAAAGGGAIVGAVSGGVVAAVTDFSEDNNKVKQP